MTEITQFLLQDVVPGLNKGFWISVYLIVPSALLGFGLGVVVGSLRVYGSPWVMRCANAFVSVFRGTPLVVQLFFWYFALPYLTIGDVRIVLSPMQAAIVGFAMCSAAYQSEYIRGGLLSIKGGQIKAARALGMTSFQTVRHVVLPQAVRRALPGCGNEIIYLIKYSSLASIITVNEMTGVGRAIAKSSWRNIEVFATVAIYYLVLVTVATLILHFIEKRMSLPGFEKQES
jgi:polar amino acid transport system permease protein